MTVSRPLHRSTGESKDLNAISVYWKKGVGSKRRRLEQQATFLICMHNRSMKGRGARGGLRPAPYAFIPHLHIVSVVI
jgi:hypothetical protein